MTGQSEGRSGRGKYIMGINRSIRWVVLGLMLIVSVSSFAGVFVSVSFGPPALPVYVQPPCPAVGYIWTPGYWGYGPNGYFWVPGTWVLAPQPGLLWTPGYWGWGGGVYAWHAGYWGPTVGFYGGINYGFGYGGVGYEGGYWRDRHFYYNRSVNNVTVVHNTYIYNKTVVENRNHVAFNGGQGGIQARANREEEAAARQRHFAATSLQTRHQEAAASNRQLWASENHGRPAIAATARPGVFKGNGVVAAREAGAPYRAPANRGAAKPAANNAVPRPGNSPARTANNVARPGTTEHATAPAKNNTPRPGTAEHAAAPAKNNTPRPPSASNRAPSPRIENTSRPNATPRPTNTPRENTARPTPTPQTETAARQPAPRPQSSPRPPAASRPAPQGNGHQAPEPHGEGHPKGRPQR